MGPWIADGEMRQVIADALKKSVDDLPDYWHRIAVESNRAAADDITQILVGRGYTQGQIDGWDYRQVFNRDLGLFWALTKGGGLADYSDLHIKKLDRREELKALTVLIDGNPVTPGAINTFGAAGGMISEDGFRFSMDTEF